jgi:hypothetical protein
MIDADAGTPERDGPNVSGDVKLRMALARRMVSRKAERNHAGRAPIPGGTGAPLDDGVRGRMEAQLGADLSQARVHTGSESQKASKYFGARAFTVGNDIHFGAGEFRPGTKEGDKLLVHELTHVVQGGGSVARKADDAAEAADVEVSQPGDPAEVEADSVAERVSDGLHGATERVGPRPLIGAKLGGVGRKIYRANDEKANHETPSTPNNQANVDNRTDHARTQQPTQAPQGGDTLPPTDEQIAADAGDPIVVAAITQVTPDVAAKMIENLDAGEPAFKTELGLGGCSWFVSEGDPYTSVTNDPSKNVQINAQVRVPPTAIKFDTPRLDAMFESELAALTEEAALQRYREHKKIPPEKQTNREMKKNAERWRRRYAERRMWEAVGALVRASPAKTGVVELKGSQFSKSGDGTFIVSADNGAIQVPGGQGAIDNARKNPVGGSSAGGGTDGGGT